MLSALHTWGRNMSLHPHVHCLVTEGGADENGRWREPRRKCFLPAKVVMQVFRGKMIDALRQYAQRGELILPPDLTPSQLMALLNRLGRVKWNVRVGEHYAQGIGVATYLARYLKGGPLKNSQIQGLSEKEVAFNYHPHAQGTESKTRRARRMTLRLPEFIRRYLCHIPPKGKHTLRYHGLYASGAKHRLNASRRKFKQPPVKKPAVLNAQTFYRQAMGRIPRCSRCHAPIVFAESFTTRDIITRFLDPPRQFSNSNKFAEATA